MFNKRVSLPSFGNKSQEKIHPFSKFSSLSPDQSSAFSTTKTALQKAEVAGMKTAEMKELLQLWGCSWSQKLLSHPSRCLVQIKCKNGELWLVLLIPDTCDFKPKPGLHESWFLGSEGNINRNPQQGQVQLNPARLGSRHLLSRALAISERISEHLTD